MVEYSSRHGFTSSFTPRWTYRKAFVAIAVSSAVLWAGVISVVHAIFT